ncbi:TonB-dependent receptor [Mangrovibacterium lignilyticum]|uniref:TonB-dependent receptor n=1 Tax=Mangrovibacterium lignilyticum TaxID=2668052 RepID=UPI0013D67605|nr:TonB-dependent receptor plug domain-containing protein [Mangrovibacterium lignilyticum]
MKTIKPYFTLLIIGCLFSIQGFSQAKQIAVNAKQKALSSVLEEVASQNDLQFAFDANYFAEIKVDLTIENKSLDDFLSLICTRYHLISEKIDNTIVIYKNPDPLPEPEPEMVKFSGIIQDGTTGEPLLFCHLGFLNSEHKGTTTNELGVFTTNVEKQDKITIAISHLGYQRLDTTLYLSPEKFHTINLNPFSIHIEAIQVFQQEKDVVEMGNQSERIAFNPKQSANLPRADDSDLISSLSLIPGVSFIGGQTAGISIRGSSPDQNLVVLDGIPVLETSHLFGNLSVLNSKYISQAFVSRGAFDATYGEKTSGVVELKGKSNYYKPSLDLSANLLNVSATANVPVGKAVSLTGSYRLSYIDKWENYLYEQILEQGSSDDGSSVSPVVQYDDLNFKIGIKPSDKHEISFNFLNSNDLQVRDYEFKEGSRFYRYEDADSENRGVSGNWFYQTTTNFQQQLTIGYNDLTRTSYSHSGMGPNSQGKGGKDEKDEDRNYLEEFSAKWSGELKTGDFTHQVGFGASTNQVTYDYLAERSTGNKLTDSIVFDSESTVYHAYLQEKLNLFDKLEARIGLRANYLDLTSEVYLQPRIGLKYKLNDYVNLLYAGGLYNQFLSRIRKVDINGNNDLVWFLPNESGEGVLEAQQHVLGVQFAHNGWAVNVEGYYKKTDGKVNIFSEQTGGQQKLIEYNQRNGSSENIGLDVLLQYKQGKFTHILTSSLSKSEEQFEVFNNGEAYPSFDDQRFKIRWTEMAKIKGWVIASNVYYHSGSPYLVSDSNSGDSEFDRLPYYMQADLSFIKRLQYKFFNLSTGVSLMNILNRQNVLEVDYFNVSDATGSYSVRTDITAMRFTPVFFVNILLH